MWFQIICLIIVLIITCIWLISCGVWLTRSVTYKSNQFSIWLHLYVKLHLHWITSICAQITLESIIIIITFLLDYFRNYKVIRLVSRYYFEIDYFIITLLLSTVYCLFWMFFVKFGLSEICQNDIYFWHLKHTVKMIFLISNIVLTSSLQNCDSHQKHVKMSFL